MHKGIYVRFQERAVITHLLCSLHSAFQLFIPSLGGQQVCFECSTGAARQILFYQLIAYHSPCQVPCHEISLCVTVYELQISVNVVGFVSMYASQTAQMHKHDQPELNRFVVNPREKPSFPMPRSACFLDSAHTA